MSGRACGLYNARRILRIPMRRTGMTHVVHIPTYDIALLCMQRVPGVAAVAGIAGAETTWWWCIIAIMRAARAAADSPRRALFGLTARECLRRRRCRIYVIHVYTLTALYVYSTRRCLSFFQFRRTHAHTHTHTHTSTQDKCSCIYICIICIPNNNI